uniref:Odorant receptor n=1 Tax=Ctenopseustis obliquana TaxID=65030 RepID=A0A097IYK7_9NEOP|nr:olfactory receptor 64 [Ctenopseustis obliquana]
MTIVQSVKSFVNKEGFDWDKPDMTLQFFHPQLEMFFAVNGIFFNNRESKIRFIWPVLCVLLSLVASGLEIMFIWHGIAIKDYGFATECFCYFFILGAVVIVYFSMLTNREKIFLLADNLNKDFLYICNLGAHYRKTFLQGQLLIWKLCWAWLSFAFFTMILYVSSTLIALLYQSTLATQDEHMVRPVIFPIWLPADDPHRSPNYEIFLVMQIILIFILFCSFCFYVCILFHLLLHYYNLMDMIIIAFGELFDGLDESVATLPTEDPRRKAVQTELNRRMGQIARWHHSVFEAVETTSSVYGPALVYQTMFSSIIICLIAFQVAEQLSEGKFDYLFGILGVGACIQLWIPCYIGSLLRNKGFSIGDCCFYCGWDSTPLGRLLRRDFVIFIQRSQEPLAIKFTALPHLQLETFSSIMSSAYSYFNMLRQYN